MDSMSITNKKHLYNYSTIIDEDLSNRSLALKRGRDQFLSQSLKRCDGGPIQSGKTEVSYSRRPLGSSINEVTQFWTIFEPSSPIVSRFITKPLVLSSQNYLPPPRKTVTSFMDEPFHYYCLLPPFQKKTRITLLLALVYFSGPCENIFILWHYLIFYCFKLQISLS